MKTLRQRLKQELKGHIQKRDGLITAPDVLLVHLAVSVQRWLDAERDAAYWQHSDVDRLSREAIFRVLREAAGE